MNLKKTWPAVFVALLAALSGPQLSAQTTPAIASLTSPINQSEATWSPVVFSWSSVSNATGYYLYVGISPGTNNVVNTGEINGTWLLETIAPGSYYARLYTEIAGIWYYAPDITFTVAPSPSPAILASPADGSTQVSPGAQLSWSAMSGATGYGVVIGTLSGASDAYQGGQISSTSLTVSLQPATKYYVQLQTYYGSNYVTSQSSFITTVTPAVLLSPNSGATQEASNVTFSWNASANAQAYRLDLGSQGGIGDVFSSGTLNASITQLNFNLSKSGKYYVRLWTEFYGVWYYSDSFFSSGSFSTLTYPADGALHVNPNVTFTWNSVQGTQAYYLYVGNTWRSNDVFNGGATQATQVTVPLAPGRRYYATIWTEIAGVWIPSTTSFVTDTGFAQMLYPANGATGIPAQATLGWSAVSDASGYAINVGTSAGLSDVFSGGTVQTNTISIPNLQTQTKYFIHLTTSKTGVSGSVDSSFTTGTSGTGIAQMIYPADGATNVDVSQPFTWTFVADAQQYYLHVGTAPWMGDVFDSTAIASTSVMIPSGRFHTGKYYLFVSTLKGGVWQSVQTSFVVGDHSSVISPADSETDVDPLAPVTWTSYPGAQAYYLYVGTSQGAKDVYESFATLDTRRYIPNLQAGVKYYLRIHTEINGSWLYSDSNFTAGTGLARLVQPTDETLNADGSAPFVWNSLPDAQSYFLTIGSSRGARNVYDSGATTTTASFVPGLVPARTYYVRLYTEKYNRWRYVDSTFQVAQAPSSSPAPGLSFTAPVNQAAAVDPFSSASWIAVGSVTSYTLHIGMTPGAWDVYDSGQIMSTSISLAGIGYGKSYYARLWANQNNVWSYTDISFQTEPLSAVTNLSQMQSNFYANVWKITGDVRLMATTTADPIPIAGTPLYSLVHSMGLTYATCWHFSMVFSAQLNTIGIGARLRTITLTGTTYESHTTVEYYDPFLDEWSISDPTFAVTYRDTNTGINLSAEEISSLVNTGQFASINPQFLTQYGSMFLTMYYMDPITPYINVLPVGVTAAGLGPQPNPADPYLTAQDIMMTVTGLPGRYIAKLENGHDTLVLQDGSRQVTLVPLSGTNWSKSVVLGSGWTVQSSSAGVQFFTFKRIMF